MRGSSGVWDFSPSTWELCLASPKKQWNEFPFPLISMFCRLQMPWLSVPMAPSLGGWEGWWTPGYTWSSSVFPKHFPVKMFPVLEALPCQKSRDTPLTLAFPDCRAGFCMDLALCVR